ncbi:MAG: hypothetical protein JWM84_3675 [Nocardioides sp.]|jgi:hypothetical protein|nr:hypothetical protein [Nocardioides sp.]
METSARAVARLEPMMSIDELAEYPAVTVRALYDWRLSGRGRGRCASGVSCTTASRATDGLEVRSERVAGRLSAS